MTFELEGHNKHQQLRVRLVSSSSGGSSNNCEDRKPAAGCTSTSHTTRLGMAVQSGGSSATSGDSSSDANGVEEDSNTSGMVSKQQQDESEHREECGEGTGGESGPGVDTDLGCYEQQSSDEDGSGSMDEEMLYCRNCTATIHTNTEECYACGHSPADDDSLFAGLMSLSNAAQQQQQPLVIGLAKVVAAQQQAATTGTARLSEPVALLWDDRMELHEEEGVGLSSHPERPDRVRAIMSRLASSGLTGNRGR
jgi:hypothetical protein